MSFFSLGCLAASSAQDFTVFASGNPRGYYFLGYLTADGEQSLTAKSMEAYGLVTASYVNMRYANRIGSGVGYSGILASEQALDFSKYSAVEVTVRSAKNLSSLEIGYLENAELGEAISSVSDFQSAGNSGTIAANTTQTITVDISAISGNYYPAIKINTTATEPNALIYSWRLLR